MKGCRIYMVVVALCMIIAGCTKHYQAPVPENFSFHGTIKTCITEKPVVNLRVIIKGTIPGSGGMFGTSSKSFDLGTASTDNAGNFTITPIKVDGITSYSVYPDTDNVYITKCPLITRDSILKTDKSDFDMSFPLSEYGYLRIFYSDTHLPDSTDNLSIDASSPGAGCGWGLSPVWTSAVPLPSPENLGNFKGIITHGTILYRLIGNADANIFYQKGSTHFTDTLHYATVFCKPNDTILYTFNY